MSKTYMIIFISFLLLAFVAAAVCLIYFCFKIGLVAGICAIAVTVLVVAAFTLYYIKKRKYYDNLSQKK